MLDMNHKWIAMTGVTGFIGSSLAAAFLREGNGVVAMTRNDPEGVRTREAIDRASKAEGHFETIDYTKLLRVIPFDPSSLLPHQREMALACDEIWHSAAEMSFSSRKLESSYSMNVGLTNELYQLMQGGSCKRFYYVSTAYTGGAKSGTVKEVLHTHPHLVNPYQVTKWSAEMSLASRANASSDLPVTLFRPAIVIGDTRTGYYPGQPFGLYTFFSAIETTKSMGAKNLILDLAPGSRAQFVPIQDLIANALALSKTDASQRQNLEIFHATGMALANDFSLNAFRKETDISITIGKPLSTLDHLADFFCSFVRKFYNSEIIFDDSKLRQVLGANYRQTEITSEDIRTLYLWYKKDLAVKRYEGMRRKMGPTLARFAGPAFQSSQDVLNIFDKVGTKKLKSQVAKRILKLSVN